VKTGAIDPLADLARIARREDLWLHIDGAYGGLAALAVPERFAAIGECDSISSMPTSGYTSPWIAAVCSFATVRQRDGRSPTRATT
jgi:glutamate/tyrosine decarboxylase-like PLP-dependent enzyme